MIFKVQNSLRRVIAIAAIIFLSVSFAFTQNTYYVSSVNGDDSNDGLSPSTAWETSSNIDVNGNISGSTILFEKGGVYRGDIGFLNHYADNVTFSSYGTGNKPVLKGSIEISAWSVTTNPIFSGNTNIYEASVSGLNFDTNNGIQHLFVNGELATIARYPNVGSPKEKNWLKVDQTAGTNGFLDDALATYGKPDDYWNGATLRIRSYSWTFRVGEITDYVSATGKIKSDIISNQLPGWGYFIDGKLEELDYPGEWYYDEAAQKVYLYPKNGQNPNNLLIEGMTFSKGISLNNCDNASIQGLCFEHFVERAIYFNSTTGNSVTNCEINYCIGGFYLRNSSDLLVSSNTINHSFKASVNFSAASSYTTNNSVFSGNEIKNNAMAICYSDRFEGISTPATIQIYCPNLEFLENKIDSSGSSGIFLKGDGGAIIKNNIVRHSLLLLNDGGNIVIGSNDNLIEGNILTDCFGNIDESNGQAFSSSSALHTSYGMGIGANNSMSGNIIKGNTVANNASTGIRLNSFTNTVVRDNIVYNNKQQFDLEDLYGNTLSYDNSIISNVFYSNDPSQYCGRIYNSQGNTNHGVLDSNYYGNPYTRTLIKYRDGGDRIHYSLNHWKAILGQDDHSVSVHHHYDQFQVSELNTNLLDNSTFDQDVSSWSPSDPAKFEWLSGAPSFEGGVANAIYPENLGQNYIPNSFPITEGALYRVKISGTSTDFVDVRFRFNEISDGNNILLERHLTFEPGIKSDYEIYYDSEETGTGRLIFNVSSYSLGDLTFDDVFVEQVNGTMANPSDSSVLFVNETNLVKTINLGSSVYLDLDGNTVTGSFNLDPYSSRVLLYVSGGVVSGIGIHKKVPGKMDVDIYPNPFSDDLNIRLNDDQILDAEISVVDLSGREVYKHRSQISGVSQLSLGDLKEGFYSVTVTDLNSEQFYTKKLIKINK